MLRSPLTFVRNIPMKKSERTFTWVLLLIVLSGGVVRTAISVHREWIGYDEASYLLIARNAAEGEGFVQSELAGYAAKFHPLPTWHRRH